MAAAGVQSTRNWIGPWLGAAATALVALVDIWGSSTVILIPLLVVGPLIAATNDQPRWTIVVGALAVGLAIPLGWVDDIGGSLRHLVGILVNVVGTFVAWRLATARQRREDALREAGPALERAARLTAAMHAGKIGEWWWEYDTGRVGWDDELCALFGTTPEDFEGTFDSWVARIHEPDRERALAAVQGGVARRGSFRFDHRCVWPDGSLHWIEGIGEVTTDRDGQVAGATGLAFDVDERHRQLDERARLIELERRARLRAEYLARVQGVLSTSLDPSEILERVTNVAVPNLGDWCSAVLAVDRPRDAPLIVAAHADERMRDFALEIQRQFPYDPDASFGAAKVIRTGEREVLTGLSSFRTPEADAQGALDRADVNSVVTVPVVGPLGVLGALQLIRGRERPEFSDSEIELLDELAGRCGAALHTAVLFNRQATSRAALDTLQRVSGGLASAATRTEVARAIIAHGISGLHATGAAVFSSTPEGLQLVDADGLLPDVVDVLADYAERMIGHDIVGNETTQLDRGVSALVTPLRIMSRTVGALAFVFNDARTFADDEISMMVTLGARCAGALERAALYERERETALVLQRRLLPDMGSVPPWLEVAARYEPAAGGRIGGDWYQLVDGGPGRMMAVVGDAVGHGVSSAAAMGQLRASIATAVASNPDLDTALNVVDMFAAQGMDTLGATAAFAWFDESGWLQYGSAGHPPIVLCQADGTVRLLDEGRRPLLGFSSTSLTTATSAEVQFRHGDLALMYTDGLVERRRESIDIGLARLVRTVEHHCDLRPVDLCNVLISQLGGSQTDDVAVLAIRRR